MGDGSVTRDGRPLLALHIAPTPFFSDRGCHMRIRGIIRALDKLGVASVLCTYHLGNDVEGVETIRTAPIPGYTKLEAGPSAFKYFADVLLFFKVCGAIAKRRPDIIHAHLHEGALVGWFARLAFFWRRIPLVFDVQGSLVGELEAHGYFRKLRLLKRLFMAMEYLITRMPDRIICSSQHSVDLLADMFKLDIDHVLLVNDGADQFDIDAESTLSTTLDLPTDKLIVIYTGALHESKGFRHLCDAITEARSRHLACHFLIVGYPDQLMRDFCQNRGLDGYCTLVGRVPYDQLGNYLALADMALEPKLSESGEASGKLLNYMGAGLPVACFNTPGNRQIVSDLGYYVPPQSGTLADGIEAVIADPEKARDIGARGRTRVSESFSWKVAGEKVFDVYQTCLARA
jgi:glycosyltransferase involved in cell wall biosynthesis